MKPNYRVSPDDLLIAKCLKKYEEVYGNADEDYTLWDILRGVGLLILLTVDLILAFA